MASMEINVRRQTVKAIPNFIRKVFLVGVQKSEFSHPWATGVHICFRILNFDRMRKLGQQKHALLSWKLRSHLLSASFTLSGEFQQWIWMRTQEQAVDVFNFLLLMFPWQPSLKKCQVISARSNWSFWADDLSASVGPLNGNEQTGACIMSSLFHLIGLWATATMKGWKLVDDSTDDVADALLILKAWQCSMYSDWWNPPHTHSYTLSS